ncbi:MAG: DEAD/DEAH box helicase [Nitrospirales bacterium]|nr:DEAD/DEAH box helicase [Nitrospira sp.]MDR4502615.1 DEAD/DEAH box helicase [Nitrospirales bacterium]
MTNAELSQHLQSLPLRRLHFLARGRIHRHFRLGKRRLIEILLNLPLDSRQLLESDLLTSQAQSFRQSTTPESHEKSSTKPVVAQSKPKASRVPTPLVSSSELLEGLGIPPPREFQPDPWQTEAVEKLDVHDVIVSVPTGSGKTFVAVEATKRALEKDQTVIYTSPLKALSNTKYMEFSSLFGRDHVGILTGDRRDNAQAPLLIMTTEILRNLFYDAASGEVDIRLNTLGLVILDESQYLADAERGVVWEETIIFCPSRARLLLLSASIGNPQDLAAWLSSIRPTSCYLVHHQNRSVPLRAGYLHPTGAFSPFFHTRDITKGQSLHLHPETKRLFSQYEEQTLGNRSRRS